MNLSQDESLPIHGNPFGVQAPIRDRRYFFGRTRETRQALQMLREGQCVAIVGPRRIGKTSLLFHLCDPEVQKGHNLGEEYLFVYIDCRGLGDLEKSKFFQWLWEKTKIVLAERGRVDGLPLSVASFSEFREAMRTILEKEHRPAFLLDEFDSLATSASTDQVLFRSLRSLNQELGIAYATASEMPVDALTHRDHSTLAPTFFSIFDTIPLGFLEPDEAERMILEMTQMVGQENCFSREDLTFAFGIGGYHPFFLQLICYHLFEQKTGLDLAAANYRKRARGQFVEDTEEFLRDIWDHLDANEQESVRLVCEGKVSRIEYEQKRWLGRKCILHDDAFFSSVFAELVRRQVGVGRVYELAKTFFEAAGFDTEPGAYNFFEVRNDSPEWRDAEVMSVYCFEEGQPVTGNEVANLMSEVIKGGKFGDYVFVIFHERLVDGAVRQLWESKRDGLIIIPIHIFEVRQTLSEPGSMPSPAYWRLVALKRRWSTLTDPYASVDSLNDPQWFFGMQRRTIVQRILSEIVDGLGLLAVFGMRRVGKTALLNQLAHACQEQGYPVARILCRPLSAQYTYADVLSEIIQGWGTALETLYPDFAMPSPNLMIERYSTETAPQFETDFFKLADAVQRRTHQTTRFVLILDELDRIFPSLESSDEACYRQYCNLTKILRNVIETPDRARTVSMVTAMEYPWIHVIDHFPQDKRFVNQLYGRFHLRLVELLHREDWDDMVRTIGELAGLEYTSGGLDVLYDNSSGHPEITRILCSCLVELRRSNQISSPITAEDVHSALGYFLAHPCRYASYLEDTFWRDPLSAVLDAQQRLMQELAKERELAGDDLLLELLDRYKKSRIRTGNPASDEEVSAEETRLDDTLHLLISLQIVSEDKQQGTYTIRIPILRDWIRHEILGMEVDA